MVDASVGMVRIQNNSNSTDAILASYRFDSCPDYNIGGEAINKTHAEYSRLYLHETFPEKKVTKRLGSH